MLRLEPMPKQAFPKDLRMLLEEPVGMGEQLASEIYRYRAVLREKDSSFAALYEDSVRAKHGKNVAFSVAEIINFFA